MTFINESWFWMGFFTAIGSVGTVLIRELIIAKTQTKLARMRQHESTMLTAYKALYSFISFAQGILFPPSDPRRDFIEVMQHDYFKNVKPQMLLYTREIRDLLQKFEAQYDCLGDSDLHPQIPFDEFVDKHAIKLLRKLSTEVEKRTDAILHKIT